MKIDVSEVLGAPLCHKLLYDCVLFYCLYLASWLVTEEYMQIT